MQVKAAGIFYTDGEKVLLLKKRKGKDKNTWGLPGGSIESGETPLAGAKRESKEEIGKYRGKIFGKIKEIERSYFKGKTEISHDWTTFFSKIKKPFKCKLSEEHTDWKWVDLNKLKKIKLHPKFKKYLKRHINLVEKEFNINIKENFKLKFREWINYYKT